VDDDGSGYGRVRVGRQLGGGATVAAQVETRYSHHRESLTVGGPQFSYSQWLVSLVAEADAIALHKWRLTFGGGWEFAATPETGDYPDRSATDAVVAHFDLARTLADEVYVHATVSRRSRFPSMREMFSGALGRFVPNPDLQPERQDLFEVGVGSQGRTWDWGLAAFAAYLTDGIERVALQADDGELFTRVNQTRIRTLGFEAVAAWRPWRSLSLAGHYTHLAADVWQDGGYTRPAEDRPQDLGTLTCSFDHRSGLNVALAWSVIGSRYSADPTADGGLRQLPAQAAWNLRFAYTAYPAAHWLAGLELFLRVDNVFDRVVEPQLGLPEPGRTFTVGVKLRLGS
jgi:iron complex outermembrane receptor protein